MIVVEPDDWHEWRADGIGASDAPAIVGLSPWASPFDVWAAKVRLLPVGSGARDDDPRFELGHRFEPVAAQWLTDHVGLYVVGAQACVEHTAERWRRATLDGLCVESPSSHYGDALAVLEVKTDRSSGWDEIPEHYRAQIEWQMHVCELSSARVVVLHLLSGTIRGYDYVSDPVFAATLVEQVDAFWRDYVLTGEQPPVDDRDSTTATLQRAYPSPERDAVELSADLVAEWHRLRGERSTLDAELTAVENELRAALAEHSDGVVDGELVASWRPQSRTSVDVAALRTTHPEIASEFERTSSSRVLRAH